MGLTRTDQEVPWIALQYGYLFPGGLSTTRDITVVTTVATAPLYTTPARGRIAKQTWRQEGLSPRIR